MPTMTELYRMLKGLVGDPNGVPEETYAYASDAEALLTYYAIPGPQDDVAEVYRKKSITALIEEEIGAAIAKRESQALSSSANPTGFTLASKWHRERSHILTTNYDTLVEILAVGDAFREQHSSTALSFVDLYPIPIIPINSLKGAFGFSTYHQVESFTLYKLHGSTSWYTPSMESNFAPIYGLGHLNSGTPRNKLLISDKRRFIVPPVYDKSTLLSHESVRSIWRQAKENALQAADRLFVIGYSLPQTDIAMRSLLWEGSRFRSEHGSNKPLYVVDIAQSVGQRYCDALGSYYDVRTDFVRAGDAFSAFVDWYVNE